MKPQPFIKKSADNPVIKEVPEDYRIRLMASRKGLMKQHRKESNPFKKDLLKSVIEANDLLVEALSKPMKQKA